MKKKSTSLRSQRRKRVLIVDDSPVIRQALIQHCLSLPRLEVVGEAKVGIQALAAIRTLKPDVITLDMHMPKMGGSAVLKAIREERLDCQVVVLAAGVDTVYRRKCLELGATYVFDKGTEFEKLERALNLLGNQQTSRRPRSRRLRRVLPIKLVTVLTFAVLAAVTQAQESIGFEAPATNPVANLSIEKLLDVRFFGKLTFKF